MKQLQEYDRTVSFTIPGDPVAWMTPRIVRNKGHKGARAIMPDKMREYQQKVQLAAIDVMGERPPMTGPVKLELSYWFTMPKSMQRKRKPTPAQPKMTKPDLDNLVKCIGDALSSVVYVDDNQVVSLVASKWFCCQGEPGRLVVHVEEVGD